MVAATLKILDSLNITQVIVVGHSFGTVNAAHLTRSPSFRSRIAGSILIDPIPFYLHLHHVAANIVYRTPRLLNANEWVFHYFAARDSDTSRALGRHVFWTETVLWKEDLQGMRTAVVLSGGDDIIEPEYVRKYLTGQDEPQAKWEDDSLEVLWFPRIGHGGVFNRKERVKRVLDVVHRFVTQS